MMENNITQVARDKTAKRCRTLTEDLNSGAITSDEFCYNVLLALVHAYAYKEVWGECLRLMSIGTRDTLLAFARRFLLPVGFMPDPSPFVADTREAEAIDRRRRELRVPYRELLDALEKIQTTHSEEHRSE